MVTLWIGIFVDNGAVDHVAVYSRRQLADQHVNSWIMDRLNDDYRDEDTEDWGEEEMIDNFLQDSDVEGSEVVQVELIL